MHALPVELWGRVMRYLGPKDWISLTETSSVLRQLSQSELYRETLVMDDKVYLANGCVPFGPHRLSSEAPANDTGFARLTRTLSYTPTAPLKEPSPDPFLFQLSPNWNLRRLSLFGVFIDIPTRSIIQSLRHLKCLELEWCTVDPALATTAFKIDNRRNKMDFTVGQPNFLDKRTDQTSTNQWTAVISAQIRSLVFAISQVDFQPLGGALLHSFLSSGQTEFLESFKCYADVRPSEILVNFLVSTPRLRRLLICNKADVMVAPPASAIPLLEEFDGHACFCEAFVTGRPVHTVSLTLVGGKIPYDVLRLLQYSTTQVQCLKLTFHLFGPVIPDPMGVLMDHAPTTIRHFEWDKVIDESFMSFVKIMGRFPNLQTIHGKVADDSQFISTEYPVEEYETLVQACAAASSSLQKITFPAHGNQNTGGKWIRKKDETWEYYHIVFVDDRY